MVEMIRCVYYALSDQPLLAKAASEAWLRSWPRADAFRTGVVANVLASGCCATDGFEQGLQALAIARRAFEECGAHYGLAWASALGMMIAMRRGDYPEATAQARVGLATVEPSLGVASYAGSMLTLLAAEVCYEQGELAQAQRYLDLGLPFIDEHGLVEMSAAGYLTRARLLRLRGDLAVADACLLEGESLGHRLRLPRLARILAAQRCALRLQAASLDDATRLAQSYGFIGPGASRDAAQGAPEEDSVCLAILRLRLAQGNGASAVGALNDALRRAQRDGHQAHAARLLALKAAHQHRLQETAQALPHARRHWRSPHGAAPPAAQPARCGAFAARHGRSHSHPARSRGHCGRRPSAPPAYLQQLLQAGGRDASPTPLATPRERTETEELTERELKILRLLKAGLGNRELAQSLFLSEATVKWHLHNIFAKLGVKNRIGALARAQEISLL